MQNQVEIYYYSKQYSLRKDHERSKDSGHEVTKPDPSPFYNRKHPSKLHTW